MSRIRANQITNQAADGAPTVQHGLIIAGVSTFTGSVSIGGTLTYEDVTNIDSVGVITARSGINVSSGNINASSGRILIGTTTEGHAEGDDLTIATSGVTGMTIRSGTGSAGNIFFSDATSGSAERQGIIRYDHADDAMKFNVNNAERLRVDTSGHMGLGVTPNTNWPTNADFKALQIGTGACVFGRGSGDEDRGGIAVNWYSTGSANKYIGNGNAARIYLADGNIYFANAGANSSGANAAMTITDRMTINVNGDIGVNCTPLGSDPFKLDVTGTSFNIARFTRSGGAAGVRIEGNGATEAVYLSLKTLNTTANSGCVIEGVDADGNGTSWIKLYTENNSTNAGAISLHTRPAGGSTTERFRIDSNGYVTKPNHPSFHARRVNNASSTTNPLVFDSVHQNNGSHYKSSGTDQGKFVAPVSGVYLFYWTAIKTNNGSVCRLYINVDGSHIYSNMHLRLQEQGTYSNGSMQAIVNLNAGQKVHISLEAGDIHGNEYTHFGGYLIH